MISYEIGSCLRHSIQIEILSDINMDRYDDHYNSCNHNNK